MYWPISALLYWFKQKDDIAKAKKTDAPQPDDEEEEEVDEGASGDAKKKSAAKQKASKSALDAEEVSLDGDLGFYSREQWTYGLTLLPSSSYLHTL